MRKEKRAGEPNAARETLKLPNTTEKEDQDAEHRARKQERDSKYYQSHKEYIIERQRAYRARQQNYEFRAKERERVRQYRERKKEESGGRDITAPAKLTAQNREGYTHKDWTGIPYGEGHAEVRRYYQWRYYRKNKERITLRRLIKDKPDGGE